MLGLAPRPTRDAPEHGRPAAGTRRQTGFSLPEMMVVLAILLLLVVIALPNLRRARESAEEAAARATLNNIHTAQEAHRITRGHYAPDFQTLANRTGAAGLPSDAETEDEASGESVMVHSGYIFRMNRTNPQEYTVTAEPVRNRLGRPHYRMNHLGRVRVAREQLPGAAGVGEE